MARNRWKPRFTLGIPSTISDLSLLKAVVDKEDEGDTDGKEDGGKGGGEWNRATIMVRDREVEDGVSV